MRPDNRPQHIKIAADLRAQIMAGVLSPGQQLPTTAQLVERYTSANATVQRALKMLKDEGFLTSRTGKGVFVRDRHPFIVNAAAYFNPADRGVTYKLLDVVELDAPADVAGALGEDRAVLRRRLMLRDDEPVELSASYYPASIATGTPLTGRTRIKGGAPAVLEAKGLPQRSWIDRLSTRPPTTEEAELLDIPEGVPVLRQFRTVYSDEERPVEVSVLIKPGHLYELSYRQDIPEG